MMLKNKILILLSFLAISYQISEAGFYASVTKSNISINESFDLTLKLENQEHLFEPVISPINKNFFILSKRK